MVVISTIDCSRAVVSSNVPIILYAPINTAVSNIRLQLQPYDTVPLNIAEIEVIVGK